METNDSGQVVQSGDLLDTVIRQRDDAHKAMLAAERDRDYYLRVLRDWGRGIAPTLGIGGYCAVACSDGKRWKTVHEWRDAALKAEKEVEELKSNASAQVSSEAT